MTKKCERWGCKRGQEKYKCCQLDASLLRESLGIYFLVKKSRQNWISRVKDLTLTFSGIRYINSIFKSLHRHKRTITTTSNLTQSCNKHIEHFTIKSMVEFQSWRWKVLKCVFSLFRLSWRRTCSNLLRWLRLVMVTRVGMGRVWPRYRLEDFLCMASISNLSVSRWLEAVANNGHHPSCSSSTQVHWRSKKSRLQLVNCVSFPGSNRRHNVTANWSCVNSSRNRAVFN